MTGTGRGAGAGGRLRVALLYGGRSAEHPVSVYSARSFVQALDPDRFEVVPVAITRDGAWLSPADGPLELVTPAGELPVVDGRGDALALRPERRGDALALAVPGAAGIGTVDVVFPLLHGPYGEDGTMQGLLELADLPYVGSGVMASALAMDKAMSKVVFERAGLPQAPYTVMRERRWRAAPGELTAAVEAALAYPVFVKPARLGSSIGISKVHHRDELAAALDVAFAHDAKVVVEQGLVARELECGVLGLDEPETSVVGEIVSAHEFYDFEAKYLEESKLVIPADVPPEVAARVRELAARAFLALDCEGLARVDFFWEEATGRVVLNEINTIPGFTPKSMFPMLWAATGVTYPDLIARLVGYAVERHGRKKG